MALYRYKLFLGTIFLEKKKKNLYVQSLIAIACALRFTDIFV